MARIEITSETLGSGVVLVKPVGKLDVFTFVELRNYLDELNAKDGAVRVVIDLAQVDYVASSGWSVLVSRRGAIRRKGGDMAACGMSERLLRVYETMKIEDVLPVAQTVDGARSLLAP